MRKYLLSKTGEIKKILQDVEVEYEVCKSKHSQLDKIKNDLLHELELDNLNAAGTASLMKELKSTLLLRRIYKDNIDYLLAFREELNLGKLIKAVDNLNEVHTTTNMRKYNRRIKKEVREEILAEIDKI